MEYRRRRLIRPEDLNAANTLFGGHLLAWIDEESALHAIELVGDTRVTTRYMSTLEFVRPVEQGDIIKIGTEVVAIGTTSITLKAEVRIQKTDDIVISVEKIVFVALDEHRQPRAHGLPRTP